MYRLLILLCFPLLCPAQKNTKDYTHTAAFEYTNADSLVKARYSITTNKQETDLSKYYYWYSNGVVAKNQGDYIEKPLHGEYLVYDSASRLIQRGYFYFGLKQGAWTRWREDGSLVYVRNYDKGVLDGIVLDYDNSGTQISEKQFKKGKIVTPIQIRKNTPMMD